MLSIHGTNYETNKGSIKVLEKLGFVHYKDSTYTKRDGSVTFDSEIFIKE